MPAVGEKSKRRRKAQFRSASKKKNTGMQTAVDGEDGFWEIERVTAVRTVSGITEFLVEWKGDYPDEWLPEESLCESALQEAYQLQEEEAARKLGLAQDGEDEQPNCATFRHGTNKYTDVEIVTNSGRVGAALTGVTVDEPGFLEEGEDSKQAAVAAEAILKTKNNRELDDNHFDWSDAGYVVQQEIERIPVHDADCAKRVTTARLAGIPVVITGHMGWAQFAAPWLKQQEVGHDGLLDLSKPHVVDVEKMMDDIGDERVPILRKRYDESKPIKEYLTMRRFLRNCWPTETEGACMSSKTDSNKSSMEKMVTKKAPGASLYLHQWLFTASETAVPKLCGEGKNVPLPNYILGDDLLRYWYNKERCMGDSPYQYLFMGNTGTMSKLHKDGGGLLISIAPIVGKKEVVLVHRADGESSLYNLEANIDKPDLHCYPMLYSARVWKSTIQPGEILLMPQGTYHQCRNVTPCLSYHRFHLDTVNLKAFFESWGDKDADDILHDEVLWNAAIALREKIDVFVEDLRSSAVYSPEIPDDIYAAVASLRTLHKIIREVSIGFEQAADSKNATAWNHLVTDVEGTLHDFRYRRRDCLPPFRAKKKNVQCRTDPVSKVNGHSGTIQDSDLDGFDRMHPSTSDNLSSTLREKISTSGSPGEALLIDILGSDDTETPSARGSVRLHIEISSPQGQIDMPVKNRIE